MKSVLLFTLLLFITLINADHMDAYWLGGDSMQTTGAVHYDMYNMKKGDTIYWYWGSTTQPACSFGNGRVGKTQVGPLRGDNFNKKICIKPRSTIRYLELNIPNNELGGVNLGPVDLERVLGQRISYNCYWKSYTSPNRKYIDVRASCNKAGCLTRYGWVENRYMC